MMLADLKKILEQTGYPVAYSHFSSPPVAPYICYLENPSSHFIADNKVYKKIIDVRIELYTNKKDLLAEGKIESLLEQNDIPYEPDEVYIASEQLFQRIYEVRLI